MFRRLPQFTRKSGDITLTTLIVTAALVGGAVLAGVLLYNFVLTSGESIEQELANSGSGYFDPTGDICRTGGPESIVGRVGVAKSVDPGGLSWAPIGTNQEVVSDRVVLVGQRSGGGVQDIPSDSPRYSAELASTVNEKELGLDFNGDGLADSNVEHNIILFFGQPMNPLDISYNDQFPDNVVVAGNLPSEYFNFYLSATSNIIITDHLTSGTKDWYSQSSGARVTTQRNILTAGIDRNIRNMSLLRGADSANVTCWTLSGIK